MAHIYPFNLREPHDSAVGPGLANINSECEKCGKLLKMLQPCLEHGIVWSVLYGFATVQTHSSVNLKFCTCIASGSSMILIRKSNWTKLRQPELRH